MAHFTLQRPTCKEVWEAWDNAGGFQSLWLMWRGLCGLFVLNGAKAVEKESRDNQLDYMSNPACIEPVNLSHTEAEIPISPNPRDVC